MAAEYGNGSRFDKTLTFFRGKRCRFADRCALIGSGPTRDTGVTLE